MPRKRKKKNMYDDASMFDIHVFIQSGGVKTCVNASDSVISEEPVEVNLDIIVDEIKEWFRYVSAYNKHHMTWHYEPTFIFNIIHATHKSRLVEYEFTLRRFHLENHITDALWKRRKKDAKI